MISDDDARYNGDAGGVQMVRVQKNENFLQKSFDKLKEAGTVWFSLTVFFVWKYYHALRTHLLYHIGPMMLGYFYLTLFHVF